MRKITDNQAGGDSTGTHPALKVRYGPPLSAGAVEFSGYAGH